MSRLSLVVFIDALGWEVLKGRDFMPELQYRKPLKSVLGYSSACMPSILSGKLPKQHGHWSFFYYNPKKSPFKFLRCLRFLPLQNHHRVRNVISKLAYKILNWSGYFQLYHMPFKHINKFDYCEKKDLFSCGGLNQGESIIDYLNQKNIPYHFSNWRQSETENIASLKSAISQQQASFAFLYLADLDGLLHQVGKHHRKVDEKLDWYQQQLQSVISHAKQHYDEVNLHICSDHGMATVEHSIDIKAKVESLGLHFGNDYVANYDSTMARFWFFSQRSKAKVMNLLNHTTGGRVLGEKELAQLGCDFEHDQYGEVIFLTDSGCIICPSDMGLKPITGMHGYHPDSADSKAILLSNIETSNAVTAITDLCQLMRNEAGC